MDRFGLQKLLGKAGKTKVEDKELKKVVVEADAIGDAMEELESIAQKMASAMKRGNEPDAKRYIDARKALIDRSKKAESTVSQFAAGLAKKETEARKAKDDATLKLIAELDKPLDKLADALADNKKLPHANEIILGLLGGGYSVGKEKEDAVKRKVKVDDETPGTSFLAEVEWTEKNVSGLELKSITKHEKAIKELDAIGKASARYRKDGKELEAFVKKPAATADAAVGKLADELTKVIVAADKAMSSMGAITQSLNKLRFANPREKTAVESLRKNWDLIERSIDATWKELAPLSKSGNLPDQQYKQALDRAKKAAAKA